jgi:hypothetical protein
MRAFATPVGWISTVALACSAGGPAPLKLSKQPFLDTGLHRVEQPGRGELFVAPDLERVRARISAHQAVMPSCQVTPKKDGPELAAARQALERDLCAALSRALASVPTDHGTPVRIAGEPGPNVLLLRAVLIEVEGDATRLAPTPRSTLSLRLSESVGGKPVLRYYEVARSGARGPLDELVAGALGRLYGLQQQVVRSGRTDVAAQPR